MNVRAWVIADERDLWDPDHKSCSELRVELTNTSDVLVQNFQVRVHMPLTVNGIFFTGRDEITIVDIEDRSGLEFVSPANMAPLFPNSTRQIIFRGHLWQNMTDSPEKPSIEDLRIRVHLDGAPYLDVNQSLIDAVHVYKG